MTVKIVMGGHLRPIDEVGGVEGMSAASTGRAAVGVVTVEAWGSAWLDRRERDGNRSVKDDRGRWRAHVLTEPWAREPITSVTRLEAREWLSRLAAKTTSESSRWRVKRPLAAQTLRNVLNLVRLAFEEAASTGVIAENPFAGLKIKRSRAAHSRDKFAILTVDEQTAALFVLPVPERWIVAVALGTGLRQGEQWALRLADVTIDGERPRLAVRYSGGATTKGGKPREVPLFGVALEALRYWLRELPSYAPSNPLGLVFPSADGLQRGKGKTVRGWEKVSKHVGRHIRWHDLRHTCATSLLAGWWGEAWALEDIKRLLGHSSLKVTERYAHWIDDQRVHGAAARMRTAHPGLVKGGTTMETTMSNGTNGTNGTSGGGTVAGVVVTGDPERRESDSNRRMTVLQSVTPPGHEAPGIGDPVHEPDEQRAADPDGPDAPEVVDLVAFDPSKLAPGGKPRRARRAKSAPPPAELDAAIKSLSEEPMGEEPASPTGALLGAVQASQRIRTEARKAYIFAAALEATGDADGAEFLRSFVKSVSAALDLWIDAEGRAAKTAPTVASTHREAIGLLTDLDGLAHRVSAFLDREVKK